MATSYDAAVSELYRAPLATFVEERKRLALELKAAGDSASAARLGKLGRPPISAWAVNQLWWRERDAFEELLETAERVRQGDLAAGAEHRSALAALRKLAAELLTEGGHGAADATLRRVGTTLAALAVAGGFEPDAPGALAADRDAPGFSGAESLLTLPAPDPKAAAAKAAAAKPDEASERAREREERKRLEEERKQKLAERRRLEGELRTLRQGLEQREGEAERLRRELKEAEMAAREASAAIGELEAALARLGAAD